MTVQLVEGAIEAIVDHLRARLNGYIGEVYEADRDDGRRVTLPPVPSDRYYISEAIHPLAPPAVFVIADRTEHLLTVQNVVAQAHTIYVGLLAEDVEIQRLQRKVWRYGKALWLALHDQAIGDVKVLVRSLDYGPTLGTVADTAGQRAFRKDVIVRCDVRHYEAVPLAW